jgi:hypothetical protein
METGLGLNVKCSVLHVNTMRVTRMPEVRRRMAGRSEVLYLISSMMKRNPKIDGAWIKLTRLCAVDGGTVGVL